MIEQNAAQAKLEDLRRVCLITADKLDRIQSGAVFELQRLADALRKAAGRPEDPNVAAARRRAAC